MPAWMKRKILSISSSTSRCSSSRKYSAIVSAARPTRNRLPGGSFICPNTITMFGSTPAVLHVAVEFLAFTASFADPAKDADALLVLDHVVDHFGEQYRLAHARPAEQTRFAAALDRHQHIDDLDPRLEDLGFGGTPLLTPAGLDGQCAIGHLSAAARRSMAFPKTSNIRERIPLPTGAFNGPPVSSTALPRTRPWVSVSAIPRTRWASS